MADTLKNLGQAALAATTLTDVYTVPASTSTVVSSVVVTNRSATPTTFRLSHALAGAADATKQYLAFDVPLAGNEVKTFTLGISMATTDVLRAYAGAATVSVNVYGVEVS